VTLNHIAQVQGDRRQPGSGAAVRRMRARIDDEDRGVGGGGERRGRRPSRESHDKLHADLHSSSARVKSAAMHV
jgi:hypothetical protein